MPPTTEPAELDDQTANLVARLHLLNTEIAERTAQANEIKTQLRSLGTGSFTHAGRTVLDLTPGSVFDPNKAKTILTPAQLAACTETVLSAKLAEQVLPPALYALCRKPKATAVKAL